MRQLVRSRKVEGGIVRLPKADQIQENRVSPLPAPRSRQSLADATKLPTRPKHWRIIWLFATKTPAGSHHGLET
jgi:hypothetical protein